MRSLHSAFKPLASGLILMLSCTACVGNKSGSTVDQAFLGGLPPTGQATPVAGNSSIVGSSPVTANGVAASTVTITLKDASNTAVAGVVPTFTATDTGATNVYGVCSATDASGVSTCTLKSTKAETKTLSLATPIAFAGGTVTFQAGPASQIVYTTQPSASTVAGVAFATQPILTIEDANGNVVTSGADSTATVSVAITTGSGALGGTVSMNAVGGVADFVGKGLNINLVGTDKVLTATKADTTGGGGTTAKTATTSAFTITYAAASQIVFTIQPSGAVTGVAFTTQPAVSVEDAFGNVVTGGADSTRTIALALTTGGGTLSGTNSVAAVAGVATYTGLNINLQGAADVLTASTTITAGPVTKASNAFAVALGSPFTQDYPFTALTNATYSFSNSSSTDLTGGILELTPSSQTDNSSTTFNSGVYTGTAWDGSGSYIRLSQTGTATDQALNSTWTPAFDKLLGLWHFDETSAGTAPGGKDFADASTTGTHLTKSAAGVTFGTAGQFGNALQLDGVAGYASGGAAALNSTTQLTISAWIKSTNTAKNYAMIVSKDDLVSCPQTTYEFRFSATSMHLELVMGIGGVCRVLTGTTALANSTWYHVAATYDGATMKIYLNGQVEASAVVAGAMYANTANAIIGARSDGFYFPGLIDDVGIWNTALTPTMVGQLYQHQAAKYAGTFTSRTMDAYNAGQSWTSFTPSTTLPFLKPIADGVNESTTNYSGLMNSLFENNLEGIYHFDEPAGTSGAGSVKDTSGFNRHGAPAGGATFGVNGAMGTGVMFDGTTGYVDLGANFNFTTSDFTISHWIYVNSYASDVGGQSGVPFYKGDYSNNGYYAQVGPTGNIAFVTNQSGAVQITNSAAGSVPLGKWTHLSFVRSGASVRIYANGVDATASAGTHVNPASSGQAFRLGVYTPAAIHFNGGIDELLVQTRALTPTEVQQLYRRTANRIKYQARTCTAANCTDDPNGANWKGPDGTNLTYFSELYNRTTQSATPSGSYLGTAPVMTFANFTSPPGANRYFQYRAIMESDDSSTNCNYGSGATWCSPELKTVSVAPIHYDTSVPTVSNATGVSYHYLTSLSETLGSTNGCVGGAKYILSPDGATWYWYTAGAWAVSDSTYAKANSAATFTGAVLNAFAAQAGTGNLYFKAFLKSDGTHACEIDDLSISGNQ